MKKAFLALALCCVSMTVLSASWGSAPVTITGYYIWDSGNAYIKTSNNQNPDGCSSATYLAVNPNASNFKYIWAQIITAHTTGQTVTLYFSECSGPYPLVSAVAIPSVW